MQADPQDSLVTSSGDVIQMEVSLTSGRYFTICNDNKAKKRKTKEVPDRFPWLRSFHNLCLSVLGSSSIKLLLNLITIYTEHVSRDVTASYSKPKRAAKLKKNMIAMLSFFHNSYLSIKTPLDETAYLEKMSTLLTMYMDMEIKASRRGKESLQRVSSKLISTLYIILNNSTEFILDTILKARFTVKSYSEICIPLFKRVTNVPHPQDLTYVRCLLIFKLWKRLLPRGEERNSVNRLAVARLNPPPPLFLDMIQRGILAKVLPTLPFSKKSVLITRYYMTSKFNVRDAIKEFMKVTSTLKLSDLSQAVDTPRLFYESPELENTRISEQGAEEKILSWWFYFHIT